MSKPFDQKEWEKKAREKQLRTRIGKKIWEWEKKAMETMRIIESASKQLKEIWAREDAEMGRKNTMGYVPESLKRAW